MEHKLSVLKTLLERSQQLVTVSHDKIQEDAHVEEALRACGFPPAWSVSKGTRQMESKGDKRKKKNKKQEDAVKRPMIATPYIEKVSEATVRIMKKQCTCGHKTLEDIEGITVAPEGQTRQGRHNRMCIQDSLCQL